MVEKKLAEEFRTPPAENKGVPFWCWNGELDNEELIRQIHILKEMGFGGFFMHARTGLKTEYLGEKWFEAIRVCTAEAEKLGMSAWLYDEDRWPSGLCGGEVTKIKEYQMKYISMYDAENLEEIDEKFKEFEILGVFAVKLNAENKIEHYRKADGKLNDGEVLKVFVIEFMQKRDFFNGFTYLDTMNKEAVQAFITSTHEKYKEQCGDLFGKTLLGIFTDEPYRGALLSGFSLDNKNGENMTPYTYDLYSEFERIQGYDVSEKLPELYYLLAGTSINKLMYDYIEVTEQMFLNAFAIPYSKWCRENKLIFTGHILHEDSLTIQTVTNCGMQRFYEYMDYPGVDILTEGNRCYWVAKQVQSVARQLNKPYTLSELYGCTGWQFNFESHRNVGAWQALLGINLRCHHLSWYTMEGEAKRDYPASIFYQSGWYKDYEFVETYFARLNTALAKGNPLCDVLVINPIESVWLYPRKNWVSQWFCPEIAEVKALEEKYFKLFEMLFSSQIDFDYGDEDIIKRHYSVMNRNGKAILRVGVSEYTKVVVSGLDTIRKSTLDMLEEFSILGGEVIFIGEKPKYIDAVKQNLEIDFNHTDIDMNLEEIKEALSVSDIKLNSAFEVTKNILSAIRKDKEEYFVAFLNLDRDNPYSDVKMEIKDAMDIENINLENGEITLLAKNVKTYSVDFAKGECKVFHILKNSKLEKTPSFEASKVLELSGEFDYKLNEQNILVLDTADYEMNGFCGENVEMLKIDRQIREKFEFPIRCGEMLQPWFKDKYGISDSKPSPGILNMYFNFEILEMPKDITLVCEMSEAYTFELNGNKIDNKVFKNWIDRCFDCIQIPNEYLKSGANILKISAPFNDRLNIETFYLTGEFGVKFSGNYSSIIALPKKLKIGDISSQGLPFYSGEVEYLTDIENETVRVETPDFSGAVVKVYGGEDVKYIAYSPYISDELVLKDKLSVAVSLTRRNTFGPLHLPGKQDAYGPESFLSSGERFKNEYQLIEQGLLKPIKVYIK